MTQTPPPFSAETARVGDTVVVALRGELDMASSADSLAAMAAAMADRPAALLVDLQHLEFMDSTGLQSLIRARALAVDAGVRLAVLNGSGVPHRLLAVTGMDATLEMVDQVSELDPPLEGIL